MNIPLGVIFLDSPSIVPWLVMMAIGQFTLILSAFRFSLGSTKFFSPSEGP
jgi:hypothetical protein